MSNTMSPPLISSYAILVILAIAMATSSRVMAGPTYHLRIVNGIVGNKTLTIHCQSKDDDLGEHLLAPFAHFNWSFKMHILGITVWWCSFSWEQGHGRYKVFWLDYDLLAKCDYKDCVYVADNNGLNIINIPTGGYDLMYRWEK